MSTAGVLLAAGAGTRFGKPKALAELDGEALVTRAVRVLAEGGCAPVVVVLGAGAEQARPLVPDAAHVVVAPDWAEGMGASLRTGLAALAVLGERPDAGLVHLVDLPWVGPEVIARLLARGGPEAVARAAYDGVPGHPVLFGRRWWAEIAEQAVGDKGARGWLSGRSDVALVECSDLGSGTDVDTPGHGVG
ncbi:nucleotidyltransferase family protein [Prauserella cavernicola]|uniref:Nucleotidyltransferase family protein n=1 Tax=Prauserella cavernicola TaxID=2800127 RepID=A0A934QTV0_9PSEU|nr:nucleotidyltransferase family protein [Prauserella cavernicola]MBK1786501.1 nucleotidyltransferase family protein [Prauserella cavernicola]